MHTRYAPDSHRTRVGSFTRLGRFALLTVPPALLMIVALRNEAARKLGFRDFHVMQLELNEQSQADVLALFDELDQLTREPFRRA